MATADPEASVREVPPATAEPSTRLPTPDEAYDKALLESEAHRAVMRKRFEDAGTDVRVEFANSRIGFFAQMNFCLNVAHYAELTGRRAYVTLSSDNYRDPDHGPNWFHYFFDQIIGYPPPHAECITVLDCCELPFDTDAFELRSARDLFFRHFAIRPEFMELVDLRARTMKVGPTTLGVHYRGTDKDREAVSVARWDAIARIEAVLETAPSIDRVFVASEDAVFVRSIQAAIADVPVVSLPDSIRSEGDRPVHLSGLRRGNRAMGQDALLNALMLARCGRLVRTTSFLSAWSSIFNPDIPVAMLNRPRSECLWFPETRVLERAEML